MALPKAILCVPVLPEKDAITDIGNYLTQADVLQDDLMQRTQQALSGAMTYSSLMSGSGYLAMEVQYNPAALSLTNQSGSQIRYNDGEMGGKDNGMTPQMIQPIAARLSLQLIFDAVNVLSAASAIAGKKEHTVQNQIDGLMSLLTLSQTRQVLFFWSKMSFRGELTSVDAQYTMFNNRGNPIRGQVNLTIIQNDHRDGTFDEKYWENAFEAVFKSV